MEHLKGILAAFAFAALLGTSCTARADDCGEDMACWEQQANADWKAEHGDYQPNLTAETQDYLENWVLKHYPDTDFYNQ